MSNRATCRVFGCAGTADGPLKQDETGRDCVVRLFLRVPILAFPLHSNAFPLVFTAFPCVSPPLLVLYGARTCSEGEYFGTSQIPSCQPLNPWHAPSFVTLVATATQQSAQALVLFGAAKKLAYTPHLRNQRDGMQVD